MQRGRPHDVVHGLVEICAERQLLQQRWPRNPNNEMIELHSVGCQLLQRRWPRDTDDGLVEHHPQRQLFAATLAT